MTIVTELDLTFLDDGASARRQAQRRRSMVALALPGAVVVVWVAYVAVGDQWSRIADHGAEALTMVFGSFVAGSTPQGGGAVAFPVFTKVLDIPTEVARSFSLCIQAVGMGTASLVIIATRRSVEWRAVAVGAPTAIAAFLVTLWVVGDSSQPFWPSELPSAYVRVTFSLVLAAMAWVVFLGWRIPVRKVDTELPTMNRRLWAALVVAGVAGGLTSALVGSGADVFTYLFVVVLFGVDPKVGVPTSVLVMAAVSVVGLFVLGVSDGQLTGLPSAEWDLFGMWLAAVPVVAIGAPLGSWVASRMQARHLVMFVMSLAVAELVTTAVFLDDLRSSPALIAYAVGGLLIAASGLWWLAVNRRQAFGLPGVDPGATLRRPDVDAADDYADELEGGR